MTQRELIRAVARATGESLSEIRRRGFSVAAPDEPNFDPEPCTAPHVIDWDEVQGVELPRRYQRRRPARQAA